jgi:putative ABC transport system permease protein
MGIPLLRGRAFTRQDDEQGARVAIINRRFAHSTFGEEDPIGNHINFGSGIHATYEIVGIVGDIKHWGLDKEPDPEFFVCSFQVASPFASIVVKSSVGAGKLSLLVRRAIDEVDVAQPFYILRPMDQLVSETLSEKRFVMNLLAIFSGLSLLLSAVGIYGVVSYSTARRAKEIGVRRALGASRISISRLVLGQGAILALAGVAIGILASLGLSRLLAAYLFGVKATDPVTLLFAAVILISVTLAASAQPAWRASGIDPAVALRYERWN